MSMVKQSTYLKDDPETSSGREKEDWVSDSKKANKEIFSELDTLLRALNRFFNIENLPISEGELTNRNFNGELIAVRDVILRVLSIIEVIIPESKKNAYWFQKFAEAKFLTDHTRDLFREEIYKQDTPEKGIYLLYDSFINLKGIVTDLLKVGNISYLSYTSIGQVISKEIRENRFFNPFRKDINPEFDVIENKEIADIVKSIKDREIKKYISVIYLYLFRFLRYISHIDITSQRLIALNSSLLILVLLRSEINLFRSYIEKAGGRIKDKGINMLLKAVSYQFSMEIKRVYLQELKEVTLKRAPQHFRGKIENSQGILKNLIEQSVVQITQFFKPGLQGEDIFESFTTRLQQSLKLREDIFVLHRFLALLEEKTDFPEERTAIFESMKNFMLYFESFTFRLIRYDDYDEFTAFFNEIFTFKGDLCGPEFNKILEKVHHFKIFLETTLRHIANRAELRDRPIDSNRVEELVRQYL